MPKTNKFANEGYTFYVIGKHIEITDAIRNYVGEKLSRIERIADRIIEIHVTLDSQKLEQICSIVLDFSHFVVKVQASKNNMYEAIDKAVDRLTHLLSKYKTKMKSYRNKDLTTVDIHVNVIEPLKDDLKAINDDIEAVNANLAEERYQLHKVIGKETVSLKMLTQGEAVMKMEISDDPFLIFKSEEDQKLKVIYRRPDHNYNIVHIQ